MSTCGGSSGRRATPCADPLLDGAVRDTCVLTGAAAAKPDSPYSTEGCWLGAQPGVLAEATEPHSFWLLFRADVTRSGEGPEGERGSWEGGWREAGAAWCLSSRPPCHTA